jgi:hypothetical protein
MSSLVFIGRLDAMVLSGQEGLFFNPALGGIDDLGFCGGTDQVLSHRPPRSESVPYDSWCRDRFFCFKPDDCASSTGTVEVTETLVYDNRMRGEIDFTGFIVIVSLQEDIYQAYLNYIGAMRMPVRSDEDIWDGRILFRIPSDPFAFPMPRGSSSPWEMRKPVVGPLKLIRRFSFDEIEVQPLRDEQGRRVKFEETVGEARAAWQPALSLRG